MNKFNNLEAAYKILNILKVSKNITRRDLVMKTGINQSYITNSISLLREKGYKIDTIDGIYGGYEYRGYIKKVGKYERIKKEEIKSIIKLYKKGVSISDLKELTGKSKESIFYHLKKENVCLDRKIRQDRKLLQKLYKEGYSLKQIAELSNVKYSSIQKGIYRYVEANRLKRKM